MGKNNNGNFIILNTPAEDFASGFPIGNGRLGAMVLGGIENERIALNNELLWRNYTKYEKRGAYKILNEVRQLCTDEKYDEAEKLVLTKLPLTGRTLYVNPYIPAGDLFINQDVLGNNVKNYCRTLDLSTGISHVSFESEDVKFFREAVSLVDEMVILVKLYSNCPGTIRGKLGLSRLYDPDCVVTGFSNRNEGSMNVTFEEGVQYSVAYHLVGKCGRFTGGSTEYVFDNTKTPASDLKGIQMIFRDEKADRPDGIHTCFDSLDELYIVIAIEAADENNITTNNLCKNRIEKFLNKHNVLEDYEEIISENTKKHQAYYNNTQISINDCNDEKSKKIEQLYNMGRYLALTSGAIAEDGKSLPITLQGLWNQDRRPGWDCDYHLDLNIQMCYQPLDHAGLGHIYLPLADWALSLMDEAQIAAYDLYGCRGLYYNMVNDRYHIGSSDNLMYPFITGGAWLVITLYSHYEYCKDIEYLKKIYPIIEGTAIFFEDFLIEDKDNKLVPIPSMSPEAMVECNDSYVFISSPSTFDLEMIKEILNIAARSVKLLFQDEASENKWLSMVNKLLTPKIDDNGALMEWQEPHKMQDPLHRHRAHLVGVWPLERISHERTPEDAQAAYKALEIRSKCAVESGVGWEKVWDALLYARLGDSGNAYKRLNEFIEYNLIDNFLSVALDWRNSNSLNWFGSTKVFQIEASICATDAICEFIFSDNQDILKFLPALPQDWSKGYLKGICGKGGMKIDLEWDNNLLDNAIIYAEFEKEINLVFEPDKYYIENKEQKIELTDKGFGIYSFAAKANEIYKILRRESKNDNV